jgi:acyl-coenzyme A synthetase/AMP-(fatty) acid ligase
MAIDIFINKIATFNEKVCIVEEDDKYTYAQLVEQIRTYQKGLTAHGVKRGAIVLLRGDYSFYSIALLLALAANACIIVPVTEIPDSETNARIVESSAEVVISVNGNSYTVSSPPSLPKHSLVVRLNESGKSGLILFSSGSTGKPKAMIHDFDNLISTYADKRGKELVFLVFLLFDHIGGVNTLLNCLSLGSTLVIPQNRDPEYICRLIEKNRINVLPSSPTFLNLMLMALKEKTYDFSSLKMITYGTEPMTESLLNRVREKFGKVKLLQTFGTSETGIARTSSQSSSSNFMRIEDGETEYKIVDGELWLRSSTQILGYLNYSMESFTEDGWFMTGDMVEQTPDGFIRVLGRFKEVINVGGEKVLPAEVESVVLQLSEVDDCVAYSAPNAITGQSVALSVTSRMTDEKALKKLIRNHCRSKLDGYKVPTRIDLIDKVSFNRRFKKMRINL